MFYDWSGIYSLSVSESYQFLVHAITEVLDRYAPKKLITVKNCDKFREGWFTVGLKRGNVKCRKLCKKAKLSGRKEDFDKYRNYRQVLDRLKKHEQLSHYKSVFQKIGNNSKLLWNIINHLIRKRANKMDVTELFYDGRTLSDKQEICDALNAHFSCAGKNAQKKIGEPPVPRTKSNIVRNIPEVTENLQFSRVSELQLCKIVDKIKPKTSSGLDGISNVLLKSLIHVIKVPFCHVINSSLAEGVFPDLMKIAKVQALYKAGENNVTDNYRPISLLPVLLKVLEMVVYRRTVEHLEKHNVIYPRQ